MNTIEKSPICGKLIYSRRYESVFTSYFAQYDVYENGIILSYLGNWGEYKDICESFILRDEVIKKTKIDNNKYVEIRSYLDNPDTTKKGRIKIRAYFETQRKNFVGLVFVSRSNLLYAIIKTGKQLLAFKNKKLKIDICKNLETAEKIALRMLEGKVFLNYIKNFLTESKDDFINNFAFIENENWQYSDDNYKVVYNFIEPNIISYKATGVSSIESLNATIDIVKKILEDYDIKNYYLIADQTNVTGSTKGYNKEIIKYIRNKEKDNSIKGVFIIGSTILRHKVIVNIFIALSIFKEKRYFFVKNMTDALKKITLLQSGKKIKSKKNILVSNQDINNIYKYITYIGWIENKSYELPTSNNKSVQEIFEALLLMENDIKHYVKNLKKDQEIILKQEKLSSLGTMVAGIAHEINNPIQSIKLSMEGLEYNVKDVIELLSKAKDLRSCKTEKDFINVSKSLIEFSDKIELDTIITELKESIIDNNNAIKRVTNIINSTKRMAYSNSHFKLCNINNVIQDAIILSSGLKFHLQIKKDLSDSIPEINGMNQELSQIFINLLSNSKDAIVEKNLSSKEGLITIKSFFDKEKNAVIVHFSDNGIGFKSDNISKIFDPFFTTKKVGTGLGLGLYLITKVMEIHKGSIIVDKKFKNGVKVILTFPVEHPKVNIKE